VTETPEASPRDSLRRVLVNRNLRRVQLAYAASLLGDWAYATAVTVWAYHAGGAQAVGIYTALRFVAMALAGPLGATVADRVSRKMFMVSTDLVRAVLVAAAAVVIGVGGPDAVVYLLGVVTAVVGAPFRSAQAGLIPRLVEQPDELTASNAVAANLENVIVFAGPALGALLVGLFGVGPVFWLNVATFLVSGLLVGGVRPGPRPAELEDAADDEEPAGGLVHEVTAGMKLVARHADLRAVALLAACQGFIWGALTVFTVVLAVRTLAAGASGVGYFDAVMGIGTVVGGLAVLTRIAKGRLGQDMAIGVLGWALPLLVLGAEPSAVVVFAGLAVIGVADPWVNLGLETIPQRIAPDRLISRVYAAVESALVGAMALGALVAPLLLHTVGMRPALVAVGAVCAAYAAWSLPGMRRLDQRLNAPDHLDLIGSVSLFAPLPPPIQEELTRKVVEVPMLAGDVVVHEGEPADRFYVIASGTVEVSQAGRVLRAEEPGDFFGEIGVLQHRPRTATVTATSDGLLLALDGDDFVAAVTRQESRVIAQEVVSRRLGV
jgi:MFS family permease